jgi:hypothetical protein
MGDEAFRWSLASLDGDHHCIHVRYFCYCSCLLWDSALDIGNGGLLEGTKTKVNSYKIHEGKIRYSQYLPLSGPIELSCISPYSTLSPSSDFCCRLLLPDPTIFDSLVIDSYCCPPPTTQLPEPNPCFSKSFKIGHGGELLQSGCYRP